MTNQTVEVSPKHPPSCDGLWVGVESRALMCMEKGLIVKAKYIFGSAFSVVRVAQSAYFDCSTKDLGLF